MSKRVAQPKVAEGRNSLWLPRVGCFGRDSEAFTDPTTTIGNTLPPETPIKNSRPPQRAPRIVALCDIRDEAVGGKAAGLARLIEMGLSVPEGFVILGAERGRYPHDLTEQRRALGPGPVAVRSSAIGEDGADASFAGQYETILGVDGEAELRDAIDRCIASLESERADAYQRQIDQTEDEVAMCVIVQQMVDARCAGVLFTADPVSGRRNRVVIDAVRGLGESLVSGHASPDHYELDRRGALLRTDWVGETAIITESECEALVRSALDAEERVGTPLDLEWAIDQRGEIQWLQARPITTLGADPNELDEPNPAPDHIYTRCNIGEMFPGACTPLSHSFTARGIEVGMQMMHQRVGIQAKIVTEWKFIAMFHGQLFLDLTAMSETATHALGSSADQMAQSICGRAITEFEIQGSPPPPWPRRIANGLRYIRYLLGQRQARRALVALNDGLVFADAPGAHELWRIIDARLDSIHNAMDHHLVSSAGAGVLAPTLLAILAGGETPTEQHHAGVAALLAGAEGVESADIVAGAERVQREILAHPRGDEHFIQVPPEKALAWLESAESGAAGQMWRSYLDRHGHRVIKELELRQPEWREDPIPLVKSIQIPLRQRSAHDPRIAPTKTVARHAGIFVRMLTRLAHQTVRAREETKSGLVTTTTRFKEVYRRLASKMVDEGLLPDADAVYFLHHDELGRLADTGDTHLTQLALRRREIHPYQESLRFPDVLRGMPEPLSSPMSIDPAQRAVAGAPVSRGRVVGIARVVTELEGAEALREGEILIAPVTDVGWSPYFSLISGLVTDVGSAVSHGAVVAREYGLPAIVNTRIATQLFQTGDRIVLDGNEGVVRLATDAD